MINQILILILFLFLILAPGLLLAGYIVKDKRSLLPLGYGLGIGLISIQLFIYYLLFQGTFNELLYFWFFLQTIVALYILYRKYRKYFSLNFTWPKFDLLSFFLSAIIFIIIAAQIFQASVKPIAAYDAVAIWSFRAQALYTDGQVNFNPADEDYLSVYSHHHYPWLTPLTEYWLRQLGGQGTTLNLIFVFYWIAIIWLIYNTLSSLCNRRYGLLFTLFLAGMPLISYHAINSYADLVLAYYILSSMILLFTWLREERPILLYASAAMAGLGFFVKNEGIFYIIGWILSLVFYFTIKKLSKALIFKSFLWLLLPVVPWLIAKNIYRIGLAESFSGLNFNIDVLISFIVAFFIFNSWNIWMIFFLFVIVLFFRKIITKSILWLPWLTLLISLFGLLSMYFLTEHSQYAINHTALSRTLIWFIVSSVFLVGITLSPTYSDSKKYEKS